MNIPDINPDDFDQQHLQSKKVNFLAMLGHIIIEYSNQLPNTVLSWLSIQAQRIIEEGIEVTIDDANQYGEGTVADTLDDIKDEIVEFILNSDEAPQFATDAALEALNINLEQQGEK